MEAITYLFISPDFSEIKKVESIPGTDDFEHLPDIVNSFKSSVWEQGWGADERVVKRYGNWSIYQLSASKCLMSLMGTVKDFS